ncbi:MAG: hypothetical protein HYY18_11020 [Planctomycetes bacterium]|nr:hypothetical protein [Planctomycetota bacterium]
MPIVVRSLRILARLFCSFRRCAGLSLRAFCRKHRLDPGQYARLESGRWTPSRLATLEKYAVAVGFRRESSEWRSLVGAWAIDRLRQLPEYRGMTLQAALAKLKGELPAHRTDADLLESLYQRIGKRPGGPSELPPLKRIVP